MRHCLHIPLRGRGKVHKGRNAKAHTVCYAGSVLTSLPRNTSQWFLDPPVFYEELTEGSWTKENKKSQSPKLFSWKAAVSCREGVEGFTEDPAVHHIAVLSACKTSQIYKSLCVWLCTFCRRHVQCLFCLLFRECDSSCWKIWTVIFQLTCIISLAVI